MGVPILAGEPAMGKEWGREGMSDKTRSVMSESNAGTGGIQKQHAEVEVGGGGEEGDAKHGKLASEVSGLAVKIKIVLVV